MFCMCVFAHANTQELFCTCVFEHANTQELFCTCVFEHTNAQELFYTCVFEHANTRELFCTCVFEHANTQELFFCVLVPEVALLSKSCSSSVSLADRIWVCTSPHPCHRIHFRNANFLILFSWFVSSGPSESPCQYLCLKKNKRLLIWITHAPSFS